MKRRTYKAGDVLVQQGSVAQALFILTAGVLVAIQSHGTGEEEAMRLAPGDSFGEAGLLAGAATMFTIRALTKATVYEIAKTDLAPILGQRPAIAAELGEILARRRRSEKRGWKNLPIATGPAKRSPRGLASGSRTSSASCDRARSYNRSLGDRYRSRRRGGPSTM